MRIPKNCELKFGVLKYGRNDYYVGIICESRKYIYGFRINSITKEGKFLIAILLSHEVIKFDKSKSKLKIISEKEYIKTLKMSRKKLEEFVKMVIKR